MEKKSTGNIVKDDPKAAAMRSPTRGQFKNWQPSGQAKSDGMKRRKLAIQMQEEMEATVEEMLKDPATDVLKLSDYISQFPKQIPVGRITAKLLHRDILNPNTKPEVRARLVEIYNKIAYGDKMDITSGGESISVVIDSSYISNKPSFNLDNK